MCLLSACRHRYLYPFNAFFLLKELVSPGLIGKFKIFHLKHELYVNFIDNKKAKMKEKI